jgi:integrase
LPYDRTPFELPCALALASGMRRGELLALRWSDVSCDYGQLRVVRTIQPTRKGLVYEEPKSASCSASAFTLSSSSRSRREPG